MTACRPCRELDCDPPLDRYALYSLQGETFPFVINCPPGYSCQQGGGYFINAVACEGTVVTRYIPVGATPSDYQAIVADMMAEVNRKAPFCTVPFPPGPLDQWCWNTPQSCTVNCPDGWPFTYTIPAGRYAAPTCDEANAAALQAACAEARTRIICLGDLPNTMCVNVAQTLRIVARGGVTPLLTWRYSGTLPTGMTLATGTQGSTSAFAGTPTTAGTYTFTVTVTTSDGSQTSKTYTIYVIEILPATLPDAEIGVAYSQQLSVSPTIPGGSAFTLASGTLPLGLTLSSSGLISGTPTGGLPASFTISVTVT